MKNEKQIRKALAATIAQNDGVDQRRADYLDGFIDALTWVIQQPSDNSIATTIEGIDAIH
jgi:hypothetical protein